MDTAPMELILWRHTEAHPAAPGQSDLERALTNKGERQARQMADWLTRRLAPEARILASPALRTQQTAAALGREILTLPSLSPEAGVEALLQEVAWPEGAHGETVVVVGHQPTLGQAAAWLLTGTALPWAVRKGAVWWLRRRLRDGTAQVLVQAVQAPDGL